MELSDVGTKQTFIFEDLWESRHKEEVYVLMGIKAPNCDQMFLFGTGLTTVRVAAARRKAIKAFMEQHHA